MDKKSIALLAVAMLHAGAILIGCGSSACSPCRPGTHASDPTQSCSACVSNADAGDARPEAGRSDCEGFTACVHSCGEANEGEPIAATCANGTYSCPAPLIPAASCSKDSWPSGSLAGCGPWPQSYDCACKSVCDQGFWTCPVSACTDAGAGASDGRDGAPVDDARTDTVSDPAACRAPLAADAGVTGLDDLPVAQLCAMHLGLGLRRWETPCEGSIVVVQGVGVDCANYWLFDATTKALQATAYGCVAGPRCTGGIPGFAFPTRCFDGTFSTNVTDPCAADASVPVTDSGGG